MTYWSTRSSGRGGELVVIKHQFPGINIRVKGVKFRDGFGVVEKGSKQYYEVKKLPQLRGAPEYDLLYLGKLSFVTRSKDIEMVYGKDVYKRYMEKLQAKQAEEQKVQEKEEAEKKVEEEKQHIEGDERCSFRLKTGELCKHAPFEYSPGKYCNTHLLKDDNLEGLGITFPKYIPKKEMRKEREKVKRQLEKIFKGKTKTEKVLEAKSDGENKNSA